MLNNIRPLLATATFRQSAITFSGTVISGLLGALFYILSARFLGPSDFGFLVVAIMVLTLITDISDLGVDTGLVRFVGKYWKSDSNKALKFIKLSIKVKLVSSILMVLLGLLISPFLATNIFRKDQLLQPLFISFIGVFGMQFYMFSNSLMQALQKFWVWSSFQVGTNLVRLLMIMALFLWNKLDLLAVLIVYISIPFVGFFISLLFFPKNFLKVQNDSEIGRDFYHYSKWIALSTFLAAFSARLDTFISARLISSVELGFYAVANQLVAVIPQIIGALGVVLAPKMAGMASNKDLIVYLKKTEMMVAGLAGAAILLIPVVIWLIPILFGSEYSQGVPILFTILLLAMLVFLLSAPIHNAIFYYFGYSKLFIYLSIVHLLIISICGWVLISLYGAIGAAITVLLAMIVNFTISLLWLLRRINSNE
ncbi:oligosaccharide flippase family protein [Candidatus Daviesbacteria bacterium]|nr:oligosaccharide flippase family protein [Candidatus Daviesbacteria bacterium]